MSFCPNCGKDNVSQRYSKDGKPYFANVTSPYANGARYFRGVHTREACAAYKAYIDEQAAIEIEYQEACDAGSAWMDRADAVMAEHGHGSDEMIAWIEANPRLEFPHRREPKCVKPAA